MFHFGTHLYESGCDLAAARVSRNSFRRRDTCTSGCASSDAWKRPAWRRKPFRSEDKSWLSYP